MNTEQQCGPVQNGYTGGKPHQARDLGGIIFAGLMIFFGISILLRNTGVFNVFDVFHYFSAAYFVPAAMIVFGGLALYRWFRASAAN